MRAVVVARPGGLEALELDLREHAVGREERLADRIPRGRFGVDHAVRVADLRDAKRSAAQMSMPKTR
jgi:hypothetical protein